VFVAAIGHGLPVEPVPGVQGAHLGVADRDLKWCTGSPAPADRASSAYVGALPVATGRPESWLYCDHEPG
jgi:hypothetical protein